MDFFVSRQRPALGECLASLAAAIPVAFLEPTLNRYNPLSVFNTKTPRERSSKYLPAEVINPCAERRAARKGGSSLPWVMWAVGMVDAWTENLIWKEEERRSLWAGNQQHPLKMTKNNLAFSPKAKTCPKVFIIFNNMNFIVLLIFINYLLWNI